MPYRHDVCWQINGNYARVCAHCTAFRIYYMPNTTVEQITFYIRRI